MKKISCLFLIIGLIFLTSNAYGQIKTATVSPSIATSSALTNEDKEIKNLKEKIATKVAELRKKDQKAVAGAVTAATGDSIEIKTVKDQDFIIRIDDALTKIYQISGSEKKELKTNEIKKGDYIIVTGPVIDKTINANFVYKDELFLIKSGKITEVDKDKYSLKVLSSDKDDYTLDIELNTQQQILNIKTLELEKIGFSKIKEGDTIHFVVKKTGSLSSNSFSALKILIIPQEYFLK